MRRGETAHSSSSRACQVTFVPSAHLVATVIGAAKQFQHAVDQRAVDSFFTKELQ